MFDRLCSAFLFLSAVVRHSIELLSTPFALRDVDCLRCKVFTSISGPQREQTATTRLYERVVLLCPVQDSIISRSRYILCFLKLVSVVELSTLLHEANEWDD